MGNAHDAGFLADGACDEQKNNKYGTIHLPEPEDGKKSIFMSQYAMNLYGVTNPKEFEVNALKKVPPSNRLKNINLVFKYKKKLGAGASARVLLVQSKRDKKLYALKEISRKFKVHAQMFIRESVILEALKHQNILEIFDLFIDHKAYYICTAYYSGGEFFDRIIKMKKFSERQALKHIIPIIKAVEFMHSQFIVHRDLKPSNMVFDKKGSNGKIKIIDFGTSEIVIETDTYPFERVGTILFCAPEWNRDRTGWEMKKSDMWAIGIICYVLMVGRLPFGEWKDIESFNNRLWFPQKLLKKLSHECKDFLHQLLNNKVLDRLTASQALKHPWLAGHAKAADADLDILKNLDTMHQVNKVKRIIAKGNMEEITNEDRNILLNNIQSESDVMNFLNEAYGAAQQNVLANNHNMKNIYHNKNDNIANAGNQRLMNARAKEVLQSIQAFKHEAKNHSAMDGGLLGDLYEDEEVDENQKNHLPNMRQMGLQQSFVQEEHAEYEFDTTLVDKLMDLGMASKNACLRAVIAVEAKSIEAAADWLLSHGEDDGIDEPVDVV